MSSPVTIPLVSCRLLQVSGLSVCSPPQVALCSYWNDGRRHQCDLCEYETAFVHMWTKQRPTMFPQNI